MIAMLEISAYSSRPTIIEAGAIQINPGVNCSAVQHSILKLFVNNPIIWATFIGMILSVTEVGPKYLNPGKL